MQKTLSPHASSRSGHGEDTAVLWIDAAWRERGVSGLFRVLFLGILGAALIGFAAQLSVPFHPTHQSMEIFMVLLWAAACGRVVGALAVALFLAAGVFGLPVFPEAVIRGGEGIASPFGGYLLGLLPAALVVGWLAERGWGRQVFRVLAAMLTGLFVVHLCGFLWLVIASGLIGAWTAGGAPFILADTLKLILAAVVLASFWWFLKGFKT